MTALKRLQEIGFLSVGVWEMKNGKISLSLASETRSKNLLYAFVVDDFVCYIGKTVQGLLKRLKGYESPNSDQSTNIRNHKLIHEALEAGRKVEIISLADSSLFSFGGFHLDIAAGLETSLIKVLSPPWNGRRTASLASIPIKAPPEVGLTQLGTTSSRRERQPGVRRTFDEALQKLFDAATLQGRPEIDVRAGDLHKSVGIDRNVMPVCCDAMYGAKADGDVILYAPPSGKGGNLRVRYQLPRLGRVEG